MAQRVTPAETRGALAESANLLSRFELAPPRGFLLPGILLLLSEEPGYGYNLVKGLKEFRFGRVDRPSVYRALAQLEADGLVESWSEASKAGNPRHVYRLTGLGEDVLRAWMGVIKEEHACLARVLQRYQATGTGDAVLAGVDGGWANALGWPWSPVSTTSPVRARTRPVRLGPPAAGTQWAVESFRVVPDRSVVLVEARSTVGPISFGAIGVTGWIETEVSTGAVRGNAHTRAHLQIAMDGLRSGNGLYDAELSRRIDARRFPNATIDLRECDEVWAEERYRLTGDLDFHGVTRRVQGTVEVTSALDDGRLVVTGDQALDIRDFDIASPTVLMLRIYPDVRVRLHVEAEPR
jgi:DNA-binding PadR family transcriptional regulator